MHECRLGRRHSLHWRDNEKTIMTQTDYTYATDSINDRRIFLILL